MKNELPPQPSELRQYLNALGAQFESESCDRDVVFKTCQLIVMAITDAKKPLPDDVFAPGMNDKLARLMISSGCLIATRMASAPQPQFPKIIVPKSKTV